MWFIEVLGGGGRDRLVRTWVTVEYVGDVRDMPCQTVMNRDLSLFRIGCDNENISSGKTCIAFVLVHEDIVDL